jgi:hypothetical protein
LAGKGWEVCPAADVEDIKVCMSGVVWGYCKVAEVGGDCVVVEKA